MILLEGAIRLRVLASLAALPEIGREFFEFVLASFDLDAGKSFSVVRFYNHIDAVGHDLIHPYPDLPWRPTTLKDEFRNNRDLANGIAIKADWRRADRKNLSQFLFEISSVWMRKQFTLDESLYRQRERVLLPNRTKSVSLLQSRAVELRAAG